MGTILCIQISFVKIIKSSLRFAPLLIKFPSLRLSTLKLLSVPHLCVIHNKCMRARLVGFWHRINKASRWLKRCPTDAKSLPLVSRNYRYLLGDYFTRSIHLAMLQVRQWRFQTKDSSLEMAKWIKRKKFLKWNMSWHGSWPVGRQHFLQTSPDRGFLAKDALAKRLKVWFRTRNRSGSVVVWRHFTFHLITVSSF